MPLVGLLRPSVRAPGGGEEGEGGDLGFACKAQGGGIKEMGGALGMEFECIS